MPAALASRPGWAAWWPRASSTLLAHEAATARLTTVADLVAVADGADVVIEAAIEDLAAKQAIFGALDRAAPPEALLATNTSALSVTAIAAGRRRTRVA